MEQRIVGRSTSGAYESTKRKSCTLRWYDGGWEVHMSIGPLKGPGKAAIRFDPDTAEEVGNLLIEYAQFAREAKP